jgi:hypothetical protein
MQDFKNVNIHVHDDSISKPDLDTLELSSDSEE